MSRTLVAILHSIPAKSGAITRGRVESVCDFFDCDNYVIVNLYAAELSNSKSLDAETSELGWWAGRREIERELRGQSTQAVLLGYGVQPPSGVQRAFYRKQLAWLADALSDTNHLPWTYGDRPVHPSRWQRVAYRYRPGSSVRDLAPELLRQHHLTCADADRG